jgi:hypothetical protein
MPLPKPMHSTEKLADLVARKQHILLQLRDIGRRQLEIIGCRDTTALIKLLAAKQSLISSLQSIERDLTPYAAENPDNRSWPSPAERDRCAAQAADCNAMLREILALEQQGINQMTDHRNQIADQLEQAHAAADVRAAYQAQR